MNTYNGDAPDIKPIRHMRHATEPEVTAYLLARAATLAVVENALSEMLPNLGAGNYRVVASRIVEDLHGMDTAIKIKALTTEFFRGNEAR